MAETLGSPCPSRKEPNSPRFREALLATLKEADIQKGTAFLGEGPDFLWVVESATKPSLFVDAQGQKIDRFSG